ncbi:uncharacterized protein LOC108632456 [Ceratina calcarata]|uniref:Uncharacterized protein LOC108632456 n=1 Tax=Ceratina calcarata TaxID=156304 RepID=A0AAJ7JFU1_9HYME|nr:uncharacterized protein LOC108632456 [Ceratina calcarata]
MIPEKDLESKMNYVQQMCSQAVHSTREQDKMLNHILYLTKNATHEQILMHKPYALISCIIRLLFYYNENFVQADNVCEWKRRRKSRYAKDCYNSLLEIYLPAKSKEIMDSTLNMIYEDKLWDFESFCFEIMSTLLDHGISGSLMFHSIWDKIESPNMNVNDTRKIIRILYELLDIYEWPDTQDTVYVIERILNLFYISITSTLSSTNFEPYSALKKGLEVSIINIVKHVCNDHLLIIVQFMCSWAVEEGVNDEVILEFGSTLEYTSYMHQVTLLENTLTPKVFPLLMQMIASSSKIISLLGNRVIQYLLDRKENKMNFDTPKIFFQDTQFDLKIGACFKEDKLFCKLHREILHDSLLKSIINHSTSRMNLEATYCTICLIAVEVPCGFTAAALVCLLMNLQDVTLKSSIKRNLQVSYHLHATVMAVMSLLCWVHKAKVFYGYVNKIMLERAQWAPHLNPPIQSQYNFAAHHILWNKPELFFVDWEARYGLWKCFRLKDHDDDI